MMSPPRLVLGGAAFVDDVVIVFVGGYGSDPDSDSDPAPSTAPAQTTTPPPPHTSSHVSQTPHTDSTPPSPSATLPATPPPRLLPSQSSHSTAPPPGPSPTYTGIKYNTTTRGAIRRGLRDGVGRGGCRWWRRCAGRIGRT